jgi:hypothetical protein
MHKPATRGHTQVDLRVGRRMVVYRWPPEGDRLRGRQLAGRVLLAPLVLLIVVALILVGLVLIASALVLAAVGAGILLALARSGHRLPRGR